MRRRVIKRFNLIVNRNRDDARFARDVSAHHEHDAKFTKRVGETQYDGAQITTQR